MEKIQSHAKLVVVGGGILGVSLLYHLTKEGWKDIVLIEKGELTSGSTWHAAGQCPHMVGSFNLAKIHQHSTNLYKQLEKETGLSTQKINYIKDLAFKIKQDEINLSDFVNLPSNKIYDVLIKVNGIGEWTINNYRLFALQDVDAWPGGDLALQESIKQIKNLNSRPNSNEMNQLSEKWKPYRGAAALLLWHYYSIKK